MTTTPGGRLLVALAGLALLALSVWSVLDGPTIHEDSAVAGDATEPSVQCFSAISGPWARYDVGTDSEYVDVSSDPGSRIALDADDVVHEAEALPGLAGPDASTDPTRASAANDVVEALQDKVDRCDQARDQRTALAVLIGLPGALLLAVALTIRTRAPQPRSSRGAGWPWPGKDGF